MALPKYLTKVTTLSKIVALILFVALPFIGFYFGMQYQKSVTEADQNATFCGGIANIQCQTGYKCRLDGNYPDAGGKCVKK